jgi:hypothetical protein
MIQRIQSIWLAVATVSSILLFFFPLASFYHEIEGNYRLFIYAVQSLDPDPKYTFGAYYTLPLLFFTIVSVIFSVSAILLYKSRPRQIRLCTYNILANIIFLMVVFFFYINQIKSATHAEPEYNIYGMALPLITLAMMVLASRAIRKDDALVKSADRLRG